MSKELPPKFKSRISELLGPEAQSFFLSLEQSSPKGLRLNENKISVEDFKKLSPWQLQGIPWIKKGFIAPKDAPVGKHVYHRAGLYYIQEPSAMIVGEVVGAKKNELILDLAASPGGKSSHIISDMKNTGLLVSNELSFKRQQALSENLERWGAKNSLQTQEEVSFLAKNWGAIFDKVLLDAPCSGEGMFRKSADALKMWSEANIAHCAIRQKSLINEAADLVKPEGFLIYSTCTFAPEENEQLIALFLDNNKDFELVDLSFEATANGVKDWSNSSYELDKTIRIWPHRTSGDGHFVAKMRRLDGSFKKLKTFKFENIGRSETALWENFLDQNRILSPLKNKSLITLGDKLFAAAENLPDTKNLKYFKPGLFLGRLKKNRFEPAHSLAMALKDEFFESEYINFEPNDPLLDSYLRGDLLEQNRIGPKRYVLITVNKYPIGWAKRSGYSLKNLLPRGLRQK